MNRLKLTVRDAAGDCYNTQGTGDLTVQFLQKDGKFRSLGDIDASRYKTQNTARRRRCSARVQKRRRLIICGMQVCAESSIRNPQNKTKKNFHRPQVLDSVEDQHL